MNKWKELAEALGLELEEEFIFDDWKYKFTDEGLVEMHSESPYDDKPIWEKAPMVLAGIISNADQIEYMPFKPKNSDKYWCVDFGYDDHAPYVHQEYFDNEYNWCLGNYTSGNCFRTKQGAENYLEKVKKKLDELKENENGNE